MILLESTIEERIEITYDEYILASQAEYATAHLTGAVEHPWIDTMRHNFGRIRKRLGDQGYRELTTLLEEAWAYQQKHNDPSLHKIWIKKLLSDYYDPMYAYQIEQKKDRVAFRGDASEIMDYLGSPKLCNRIAKYPTDA